MASRLAFRIFACVASPLMLMACAQTTAPADSSAVRPASVPAGTATTGWYCAQLPVATRVDGERLRLFVRDQELQLNAVRSASGARYQTETRPTTEFWVKGSEAQLSLEGQVMPTCYLEGKLPMPIMARGNEPFWTVAIDSDGLSLRRPSRSAQTDIAYRHEGEHRLRQRFFAETSDGSLELVLTKQVCRDTMTGMPYPYHARLRLGESEQQGCAGDPEQLLQGAEWHVQRVGDSSTGSHVLTIAFLPDGRVVGNAGCNRFFGSYQLSGEGIRFAQMGSTRMACEADRMALEQDFLRILSRAYRVEIDNVGALVIRSENRVIRAFAL
ncbi:MAG: META domain-containing protein [Idiomarina sp.]|nr:META domain-containing protein [Idiomarina sp.]